MKTSSKRTYPIWPSVRYMLSLAKRCGGGVAAGCVILAVLEVGQNLTQLFIAPEILKRVERGSSLWELLAAIGVYTAALFLLTALRQYAQGAASNSRAYLRTQVLQDITRKSFLTAYPNCEDPAAEKLRNEANSETGSSYAATEHIWTTFSGLLGNFAGFVIYLAILSNINWILIGVTLLTSCLSFWVRQRTTRWQILHNGEHAACWRRYAYLMHTGESVEAAKDIRIFGLKAWIQELYIQTLALHKGIVNRSQRRELLCQLLDVVLTALRSGIAYGYLLVLALRGGLSASAFLLYLGAISGFSAWVTGILNDTATLYRETQSIGIILEYLNYPEPFRFDGGEPLPAQPYTLRLEDVTFRYPGSRENLFEHLNLEIRPGEKLAVVGLNGAGKTTLVKLLCGFYDPNEGRVTLNGIDIRRFNRREYYGLLCAVYQDFSVLDVTVAENIAQRAEGIDLPRVWQCLEQVELADMVKNLPQGLDTHVGRNIYPDGVLFSGGQTQRLMLARALYKGGGILVLDEPTAALDPIAESNVYQAYSDVAQGKTSLFISHRLASTRFCDRIILLADGAIAEMGTHEELLKKRGAYAKLFEIQSRYYQQEGTHNEA